MGKKLVIIIAVVAIVGVAGALMAKRNVDAKYAEYEELIAAKDEELLMMQEIVEEYGGEDGVGPMVTVYRAVTAKTAGTEFTKADVEAVDIPLSVIEGTDEFITDLSILTGTIYKVDVKVGMPICKSLFYKELLTQTDRYYDIVVDLFPVGAKKGDYFDLRMVTPAGLDYIVLAKKRAVEFYGEACRFILSQEEIHQYQSALVDTFMNKGTYMYMTVYIEPAMQKKSTIYYPITDQILALMMIDPNIVQLAEIDMLMRQRAAFEGGLLTAGDMEQAANGRELQVGIIQKAAAAWLRENKDATASPGKEEIENTESAEESVPPLEDTGNLISSGNGTIDQDDGLGAAGDLKEDIQGGISGSGW